MKILIGNRGLVGTHLSENIKFDFEFNTSNIASFLNDVPDGCDLYLSCLPATKWLVNKNLTEDLENINALVKLISTKTYNKIILISTIDVYLDSPLKVNEDYKPNAKTLNYGYNRYHFELLVTSLIKYGSLKIFRLPAIFNKNIKKNVLFDLLNNNNINQININSEYQWYNLDNLTKDIERFSGEKYGTVVNLFTEPLETKSLIELFPQYNPSDFFNGEYFKYDYTTLYGEYIQTKSQTLDEIKNLINEYSNK